jgi:Ca-activated chloride channel family protein
MIHFAWPWMLLCLPLPWLVGRLLPPAKPQGGALFLPFADAVSSDWAPSLRAHSRWRVWLFALMWLLLVGAATRPQWLGEPQAVPTTGRRLMMAVDTSGSMQTQDMAGGASRLQVVQAVAGDFIRHRTGDQVGLILFGTRPYLQAPLTADLSTVGQFLNEAMIGVAGPQTAIGDAIGLGIKRLEADRAKAGPKSEMVLILLTDGGNDAGLMDPIQAAKMAATAGLKIYTIGVGAAVQQGLFGSGGNTDLDEATLKSIAQLTGGAYFRAADVNDLRDVYAQIDKIEPASGQAQWYRPSSEWFAWPLGAALLLSVLVVLMRERT